jgi:hypothetical protein
VIPFPLLSFSDQYKSVVSGWTPICSIWNAEIGRS